MDGPFPVVDVSQPVDSVAKLLSKSNPAVLVRSNGNGPGHRDALGHAQLPDGAMTLENHRADGRHIGGARRVARVGHSNHRGAASARPRGRRGRHGVGTAHRRPTSKRLLAGGVVKTMPPDTKALRSDERRDAGRRCARCRQADVRLPRRCTAARARTERFRHCSTSPACRTPAAGIWRARWRWTRICRSTSSARPACRPPTGSWPRRRPERSRSDAWLSGDRQAVEAGIDGGLSAS